MGETSQLDTAQISRDISQFRQSALLFSRSHPTRLIDGYDNLWVAVLDGEVRAQAEDIDTLFLRMANSGIDARRALVRHVQRNQRTLVI